MATRKRTHGRFPQRPGPPRPPTRTASSSTLALAAGVLISVPVLYWLHNYPPDLSNLFGDFTMSGSVVRPVLRAEYSLDGPIYAAVALLITSILSALYPAYRAVKILPADALADS